MNSSVTQPVLIGSQAQRLLDLAQQEPSYLKRRALTLPTAAAFFTTSLWFHSQAIRCIANLFLLTIQSIFFGVGQKKLQDQQRAFARAYLDCLNYLARSVAMLVFGVKYQSQLPKALCEIKNQEPSGPTLSLSFSPRSLSAQSSLSEELQEHLLDPESEDSESDVDWSTPSERSAQEASSNRALSAPGTTLSPVSSPSISPSSVLNRLSESPELAPEAPPLPLFSGLQNRPSGSVFRIESAAPAAPESIAPFTSSPRQSNAPSPRSSIAEENAFVEVSHEDAALESAPQPSAPVESAAPAAPESIAPFTPSPRQSKASSPRSSIAEENAFVEVSHEDAALESAPQPSAPVETAALAAPESIAPYTSSPEQPKASSPRSSIAEENAFVEVSHEGAALESAPQPSAPVETAAPAAPESIALYISSPRQPKASFQSLNTADREAHTLRILNSIPSPLDIAPIPDAQQGSASHPITVPNSPHSFEVVSNPSSPQSGFEMISPFAMEPPARRSSESDAGLLESLNGMDKENRSPLTAQSGASQPNFGFKPTLEVSPDLSNCSSFSNSSQKGARPQSVPASPLSASQNRRLKNNGAAAPLSARSSAQSPAGHFPLKLEPETQTLLKRVRSGAPATMPESPNLSAHNSPDHPPVQSKKTERRKAPLPAIESTSQSGPNPPSQDESKSREVCLFTYNKDAYISPPSEVRISTQSLSKCDIGICHSAPSTFNFSTDFKLTDGQQGCVFALTEANNKVEETIEGFKENLIQILSPNFSLFGRKIEQATISRCISEFFKALIKESQGSSIAFCVIIEEHVHFLVKGKVLILFACNGSPVSTYIDTQGDTLTSNLTHVLLVGGDLASKFKQDAEFPVILSKITHDNKDNPRASARSLVGSSKPQTPTSAVVAKIKRGWFA